MLLSGFILASILGAIFVDRSPVRAGNVTGGKTQAPSYVNNVTGNGGYDIIPLLTVGDEVSLLEGNFGSLTVNSSKKFAFAGIPDGLGLVRQGGFNYVFINHEISTNSSSFLNGSDPDQIKGARVSLFQFDSDWNAIGGKNLIDTVVDNATGVTYALNPITGSYESQNGSPFNFSRFCSGYLAQSGFGNAPVWFAPEESDFPTDRGWAVSSNSGEASSLDGLGRYAKEQVLAASQYRENNSNTTVLISTEDNSDGELYMWVGEQTAEDPQGLKNGNLYVMRVSDNDWETMPEDQSLTGTWTLVPKEVALGSDIDLSDWVNADDRSTNFRRPEDIAEDPNNPGTFYFVTTGRAEKVGTFEPTEDPNESDNPYGKLYGFSLNPNDPTAPFNISLLNTGGLGKGVSYDNITVDGNGNVVIQEDETAFGGDIMTAEGRDNARIWSYNIATDLIAPIFELDESLAPLNDPLTPGQWESSGIITIDSNAGGSSYLFDVQAHTILDSRYVEGGQLLFARPTSTSQATPEGGTSAALLGFGLSLLAYRSRKQFDRFKY